MTVGELRRKLNYLEDSLVLLIEDPNDFRSTFRVREVREETEFSRGVLVIVPQKEKLRR